jgi:hypothetical protein
LPSKTDGEEITKRGSGHINQEHLNKGEVMTGWKSKWGGILVGIGTALGGAAAVAPTEELKPWMVFLGVLIGGFGTALLGVGIAHKVEKAGGSG